jgi:type IV secretion system protein VirB8
MSVGKAISAKEEAQAYLGGQSWDMELVTSAKKSERNAWLVAAVAICVAVPLAWRMGIVGPGEPAYPVVIAVDKSTGNMEVMETPNNRVISDYQPLIDMYWAKKYVIARESYYYTLLQQDYDTVLALSTDQIASEYAKQYEGDNSPEKKLAQRYEIRVQVMSVVLPPNEDNKVVVRYRKVVRQTATGGEESSQTLVASFAYTYTPSMRGKVGQLINNPLGFKVTSYRTDVELAPSAATSQ